MGFNSKRHLTIKFNIQNTNYSFHLIDKDQYSLKIKLLNVKLPPHSNKNKLSISQNQTFVLLI